jgi:hypothetical protein
MYKIKFEIYDYGFTSSSINLLPVKILIFHSFMEMISFLKKHKRTDFFYEETEVRCGKRIVKLPLDLSFKL